MCVSFCDLTKPFLMCTRVYIRVDIPFKGVSDPKKSLMYTRVHIRRRHYEGAQFFRRVYENVRETNFVLEPAVRSPRRKIT